MGELLWWIDPAWMPGSYWATLTPFFSWKEWREKKLVGQDKGNLIKYKQRLHVKAKENKRFNLYFSSAGEVQILPGKQGFSMPSSFSRRRFCNNKYVCILSFLLAFIAEQTSCGIQHPFGHLESDVLAVYLLQILPLTPASWWELNVGESLYAVQALLSRSQNTLLTKHSTMRASGGEITSISAIPNMSVQTCIKEGQDL